MLFSSLTFIFIFLPLVLGLYFIAKDKYRNHILLLASLLFYSWGEPKFIVLMLISIIFNYIIALIIDKKRDKKILPKLLLIFSLIINIGMLFSFKYLNFFITNINSIFNSNISLFEIALPIGISFYTFQILSYVVDVYRKQVPVQKNIFALGTYIAFFPQLIAGPIVRYSTIAEQLEKRKCTLSKFTDGLRRFILGFAKKIIIANNVALVADTIFNSSTVTEYSWVIIIIALLAYTLQIYFDFSGYSDMAIGLGKMFGFEFLENFNYPYISQSITDFWRRWHISLSSWFRDYVYIPLGGNRVKKIKWIRNIFVVWLLTGLWHGASWNYVIWGLYFFVILLSERLLTGKLLEKLPKIVKWIYAFILINIGWLIFRIEDVSILKDLFVNLVTFKSSDVVEFLRMNYSLLDKLPYMIIGLIAMFPIYPAIENKLKKHTLYKYIRDILIMILLTISICFLLSNSYNPFIYFRF